MDVIHPDQFQLRLAQRAERLSSSAIRELLKVTAQPDIISFAGGLPSPTTFPVDALKAAFDKVLSHAGTVALQYGPTDGYQPLRQWIADSLSVPGAMIGAEQVLMTSGSQQGLDLLGKILIDDGSRVLVETPSYLGALQAFSLYGPQYASVAVDGDGLVPSAVPPLAQGACLLYTQPNFQNPTGLTLPLDRRHALVETCARLGLPLVEDDPYRALSFDDAPLPTMLSMNPQCGIYLGTFSKVLAPGIRLGYMVAPPALIRRMELAKQGADLHTSQLTQMVVYELIKDGFLSSHVLPLRRFYRQQCRCMLDAMTEFFPPTVRWTEPRGGMFIWVTLPPRLDASALLKAALADRVAFVPGAAFHANAPLRNTLRLSFATVSPERIRIGIEKLGRLIDAMQNHGNGGGNPA